MIVFALGAFLAAVAGVVAGGFVGVYPGADFEILPYAFVVVIVGRYGKSQRRSDCSLMVGLLDNFAKRFFLSCRTSRCSPRWPRSWPCGPRDSMVARDEIGSVLRTAGDGGGYFFLLLVSPPLSPRSC